MTLFATLWRRRALKTYARKLPTRLHTDYGANEYYTPAQIKVATGKLNINPNLIPYGYAAFLPPEVFAELPPPMPAALSYEEARTEFLRLIPPGPVSTGSFYESGIGLQAPADWNGP
jgi:hypothetical protein